MYFLRGVAIGILVICEIYMWYNTETVREFIFYSVFANIFGVLSGIPAGLSIGRIIKKRKKVKGQ
jgi:hypothetical protein